MLLGGGEALLGIGERVTEPGQLAVVGDATGEQAAQPVALRRRGGDITFGRAQHPAQGRRAASADHPLDGPDDRRRAAAGPGAIRGHRALSRAPTDGRSRGAGGDPTGVPATHETGTTETVEGEHLGDRSVEERAVVRDDDHRARPPLEEVFERPQRVEIQVVGRLVEQQHVRLVGEHEQQLQPASLAAGQRADLGPLRIGIEPEPFHQRGVLMRRRVARSGDGVANAHRGVELDAVLVVVADAQRAPPLDATGGRLQAIGDQFEQGGLAGAVRTDDPEPITGLDHVVEVAHQWRRCTGRPGPGPGERDVVQLDHLRAEAGRAQRGEVERTRTGRRLGPALDDRGRRSDAGLGLARARRSAAAEPGELGTGEVSAHVLGDRRPLFALDAPGEVRGVARPGVLAARHVQEGAPPIEFEHLGRDAVEHVTVVGDEHEAAGEVGEPPLEKGDGVEVEVVRRLVEHEQVVLAGEQAGKGHALALPTRQGDGLGVEETAHAEAIEHRFCAPRVDGIACRASGGDVSHRAGGHGRLLWQVADAGVTSEPHDAGLRLLDAGECP